MLFFVLLSRLPFRILFWISDVLFFLVYYGFGYRREVVWNNLERSFPEKPKEELRQIEQSFYRHLCDVVVETIKLLTISEDQLRARVTHENPDGLQSSLENGGSCITLAPHLGNWEWMLVANVVIMKANVDAVYKPLTNAFFDRLMLRIRTRFGPFPVPSQRILRIESGRKHISRIIAMVADQTPGPEGSYVTRFLNQPTLFFKGPQKLAELFSYPVYYSGMKKTGRGRYHLFVEKIAVPPFGGENQILEAFAQRLEMDIQESPHLWLWSHKRWKHQVPKSLIQ